MDSAALLDLLGNENRRRILRLLAHRPCYVTEISEAIDVSPKAVIGHLRKLENDGLVESRVDDQRRKYFRIARSLRLEVTVSPYGFATKSSYAASKSLDLGACSHLSVDLDSVPPGGEDGTVETDGSRSIETDGSRSIDGPRNGGRSSNGANGTRDARATDHEADIQSHEAETSSAEAGDGDAADLADRLQGFEQLERELSLAQRWAQGRRTELMEQLTSELEVRPDEGDARFRAEILAAIATGAKTPRAVSQQVSAPPVVVREALTTMERRGTISPTASGWEIRR